MPSRRAIFIFYFGVVNDSVYANAVKYVFFLRENICIHFMHSIVIVTLCITCANICFDSE
jgi:hypothetical protein